MASRHLLVLCTCPDQDTAERLAGGLVEQNLAACVNILPPMLSIYKWQGQTQRDTEHQMLIKTTGNAYPQLQQWLAQQHPYEIPEIIATPIDHGLPTYLDWLDACCQEASA